MAIANLRLHPLHRRLNKVLRRPILLRPADIEAEVLQQLHSLPRVRDLGMKLHRPDPPRLIRNSRHSIRRLRRQRKALPAAASA